MCVLLLRKKLKEMNLFCNHLEYLSKWLCSKFLKTIVKGKYYKYIPRIIKSINLSFLCLFCVNTNKLKRRERIANTNLQALPILIFNSTPYLRICSYIQLLFPVFFFSPLSYPQKQSLIVIYHITYQDNLNACNANKVISLTTHRQHA